MDRRIFLIFLPARNSIQLIFVNFIPRSPFSLSHIKTGVFNFSRNFMHVGDFCSSYVVRLLKSRTFSVRFDNDVDLKSFSGAYNTTLSLSVCSDRPFDLQLSVTWVHFSRISVTSVWFSLCENSTAFGREPYRWTYRVFVKRIFPCN